MLFVISTNVWLYSAIPTLLYTWLIYDIFDIVANQKPTRNWLNAVIVCSAVMGTVGVNLTYTYYAA